MTCPGLGSIPFGIGIDQFNSAPIPELELELKDFEQKELELELNEKELSM